MANSGQVVTSGNILGQTRISTLSLHPLVAVANSAAAAAAAAAAQGRGAIQAQGAKVIAQPTQGEFCVCFCKILFNRNEDQLFKKNNQKYFFVVEN